MPPPTTNHPIINEYSVVELGKKVYQQISGLAICFWWPAVQFYIGSMSHFAKVYTGTHRVILIQAWTPGPVDLVRPRDSELNLHSLGCNFRLAIALNSISAAETSKHN